VFDDAYEKYINVDKYFVNIDDHFLSWQAIRSSIDEKRFIRLVYLHSKCLSIDTAPVFTDLASTDISIRYMQDVPKMAVVKAIKDRFHEN